MLYRIVVISDVHHDVDRLEKLLPVMNAADCTVFCGDGLRDVLDIRGRMTAPLVCVRGNNDFFSDMADATTVNIGGLNVFVTHGHRYNVRHGVSDLAAIAQTRGCAAAFFGHTHSYHDSVRDGVHLLNPGALCDGSYAVGVCDGKTFSFTREFIDGDDRY